jgi:preprotein translocase subunit SecA
LEYDDVLNSQRERIYEQRERIFDKEDLREDVTEMLRTEGGRRITEGMQDEEGLWKLLAYLEDTQPPIDQGGVFHPSFTLQLMMDHVGQPENEQALRKRLLSIAAESLEAWHEHLQNWAGILMANAHMGFENQLAERLEALDNYVDGLGYEESGGPRNVKEELSGLVHVPLRLNDEVVDGLEAGSQEVLEDVSDQIRATLMQIFIRRLILTFERRFSDNWNLKAADLADQSWDEVQTLLMGKVADTLQRRGEHVLGEDGEISRDLDTNQELLSAALEDRGALMRLLILMTQGRVITFDERTHQRKMKAVARLTYVFKGAQLLEAYPPEDIQAEVISHLETAQDKLSKIWGASELTRLHNAGQTLGNLTQDWQARLSAALGEDRFERIKSTPLDRLPSTEHNQVVETLGRYAQNRLYRHLLLSKISELWVEYLTKVEALRVSVRMEAYGQRDPLVEYKSQATTMFSGLLSDIRAGVIAQMFRARLVSSGEQQKAQAAAPQGTVPQQRAEQSSSSGRKRHKKTSRKRH